jgi:hypothetical protein
MPSTSFRLLRASLPLMLDRQSSAKASKRRLEPSTMERHASCAGGGTCATSDPDVWVQTLRLLHIKRNSGEIHEKSCNNIKRTPAPCLKCAHDRPRFRV